ncbi:MAG TPA: ROK family transcriptional regulator [Catenuloplanes sp.]
MPTGPQPADFADVRATNLAVVLRYVRAHAPCSRADIAATTGLNKATVSSLVADLIDRRLVRETGLTERRIGRPATMLTLDGRPYAAIGVQVAADHLTAVALDLAGEQLLSWQRSFGGPTMSPGRAVSVIAALAARAATRVAAQGRRVLSLTVGVPGLVDGAGQVSSADHLGWRDLDLRAELRAALRDPGYDVTVDNDANLCVLAEYRFGANAGTGNLVCLTGGMGIGGGAVVDGLLLRGARGLAGQVGHLQLDAAGPRCPCGRQGCFETLAGIPALVRRALPDAGIDGPLADLAPEVARLVARAREGDERTLAALAETGGRLGQGAAVLANLLNPEVVVLGGYFTPLAPWLLPAARTELLDRTVAPQAGGCQLVASSLDLGAAAMGGAARALDAIDAGRLPPPRPPS